MMPYQPRAASYKFDKTIYNVCIVIRKYLEVQWSEMIRSNLGCANMCGRLGETDY